MEKITMFLMNKKGFSVLESFLRKYGSKYIDFVVVGQDKNVERDYSVEIRKLCESNQVRIYYRSEAPSVKSNITFAIGWRWLIKEVNRLIVFHDSLLPQYRGFSPLVNCLINHEETLGVTALFASKEYDRGEIIAQKSIDIQYPIKVADAIELISPIYISLVETIMEKWIKGEQIQSKKQDESFATYSLWLDEEDYQIDWKKDAEFIKRFIDATGFPFKGASSYINGKKIRINDSIVIEDVTIENRTPGKVIFMEDGIPIIVCGKGLIKILSIVDEETKEELIPLKKYRVRFK
ncbi:formyltransferase family protein [Paenibacillus sp. NPDC056933]|uniref:formyltransferase family protein n=1 Tax=Paenibacillus sp. NPDC056933 TaxID=3345968 RepID=UPI003632BD05